MSVNPNDPASPLAGIDTLVLCGGLGTRLRPAVSDLPKALAPVEGRPFLSLLLEWLHGQGLQRFVLCTGHLAEHIEAASAELEAFGTIVLSQETERLGTGGALVHALPHVHSDPFIAVNGDSLSRVGLSSMMAFHRRQRSRITVSVTQSHGVGDVGRIDLAADGRILAFEEKDSAAAGRFSNSGVYVIQRDSLLAFRGGRTFSLETGLFPSMAGNGLFGFVHRGDFIDIGTPDDYTSAARRIRGMGGESGGRPDGTSSEGLP